MRLWQLCLLNAAFIDVAVIARGERVLVIGQYFFTTESNRCDPYFRFSVSFRKYGIHIIYHHNNIIIKNSENLSQF